MIRCHAVYTPDGLLDDHTVVLDDQGTIQEIRPGMASDGAPADGILLPGLVNAHTHLELSWMEDQVRSRQRGFVDWARRSIALRQRAPEPEERARITRAAARRLYDHGVAGVGDVSNGGDTAQAIRGAGLSGTVHHEQLSFSRHGLAERLDEIPSLSDPGRGLVHVRPSPHATYSTAPQLIRAAVQVEGPPATIHVSEDPDEHTFIDGGTGPFASLLDDLGVDWRWWDPVGLSPVAYLDALGLLDRDLLLVHAVHIDDQDRDQIRSAGAMVCLCPRSNWHITGDLPDVDALVEAGIPFAIGTDSLASSDSLDPVDDVAVLAREHPDLPDELWVRALTLHGARAIGCPRLGRIERGAAPGLLFLPGATSLSDLWGKGQTRHWLATAGHPREEIHRG